MAYYRRGRIERLKDGAAGICLTLFLFSLAVVLVLNAKWLYALDVTWLNLDKVSGMHTDEIRANYDALIRYNQVWQRGELVFPTLPMSREGAIHFAEVKRIFDGIQIVCVATGVLSLLLGTGRIRKKQYGFLRLAGVLSLVIPAVTGILAVCFWDRFFILFHQLFFRNDYWLFDPVTDPVILILPDTYFLHCAVGIICLILAGSLIMTAAARRLARREKRRKYRK